MPNPAIIPAAISAAGALGSANQQSNAQQRATNAQVQMSREAIDAQERALAQLRGDLAPYTNFGASMVPYAQSLFGFTQAPQSSGFTPGQIQNNPVIPGQPPQPGAVAPSGGAMQTGDFIPTSAQTRRLEEIQGRLAQLTPDPNNFYARRAQSPAVKIKNLEERMALEKELEGLQSAMNPQPQSGGGYQGGVQAPQGFSADAGVQNLMSSPLFTGLLQKNQEDLLKRASLGGRAGSTGNLQALQDSALLTGYGLLQSERGQLLDAIRLGQASAAQQSAAGTQSASSIGNLLTGIGNAQAAGSIQGGNINANTIGQLAQAGGLLAEAFSGGGGGGGGGSGSRISDYNSDAFRSWVNNQ